MELKNSCADCLNLGHAVTVIGIIYEGNNTWLKISNHGQVFYVDMNQYFIYATENHNIFDQRSYLYNNNILLIESK